LSLRHWLGEKASAKKREKKAIRQGSSLSPTVVTACATALQIHSARFSTCSSHLHQKAQLSEACHSDLLPAAWKAIGEVLNLIESDSGDSALTPERVRGFTAQVLDSYPDLELAQADNGQSAKGETTFMAYGAGIICPDCSTTGVFLPKDGLAWSSGTRGRITCKSCHQRRSAAKWALA
jgi:hypothetical protein